MKLSDIQSERIRRIISGGATPATAILALDELTAKERDEANQYFQYANGLHSAANAEQARLNALDC